MKLFHLPEASTHARSVDHIFIGLIAASALVIVLVVTLVVVFSVRYRAGSSANRGQLPEILKKEIEIGWTLATFFAFLFLFWWAATSQLNAQIPPQNAFEIHVVARQWMWKIQHPSGAREIDTLHVPMGVPVKLVMTSQDVIHSFYVPAFRVKQDVLPGRYTFLWFTATRPGTFDIECAEYCGLDHSQMGGKVIVMDQAAYARWAEQPNTQDLVQQGERTFVRSGCGGCHGQGAAVHAPPLRGVYGSEVPLQGGGFVKADEAYLRDSVLLPEKQVVAGYAPIMPSFQGVLTEDQLVPLIAYLKSLKGAP